MHTVENGNWPVCRAIVAAGLAVSALAAEGCGPAGGARNGFALQIVSNRADLLSGEDALVRVDAPGGVETADIRVTLNGKDVTSMFRSGADGAALTGLVTGLADGANTLAVSTAGGATAGATMTLVNHPVTGPVFAGPKERPFICETNDFKLRSGGTLGPPLDENCSAATRVDYLYRATDGGPLKPLVDPKMVPADLARITTSSGRTVPYVVRIETGTINRAIYQIAMLHDASAEPAPDFQTRTAGWNGRLIFTFGGGCMGGWYHQATTTGGVEDDVMLRQGYAIASSTLNVAGNNCDEVLSAETMMMVKEHFIEAFGKPAFTMGWGCSGGSYQQLVIADTYPGLLDGVIPGCTFPDMTHALTTTSADSRLLDHYFTSASSVRYTDEQKRAIGGYVSLANLIDAGRQRAARINPTETCPDALPVALRYDPVKNPTGARCSIYDHTINVYGRDPQTGFARRPLDNVGIQYGLVPLNAGVITKEQFLDLNERIGGFDSDANMVAARTEADQEAVRIAYRTGRITSGGGGLSAIPILEYRAYQDEAPKGDPHLRYHSFSLRARLIKANGHADNHVMLLEDVRYGGYSTRSPQLQDALRQMDAWLTSLAADTSADPAIDKIRRAKPAGLTDACWTRDETPRKIVEPQTYLSGECERIYPAASFPRGQAGAPIAADVIKCQLKPVDRSDYHVAFTGEETARLQKIFPAGVCDWSRPGVEQQRSATWLTYGAPAAQTSTSQ
jgi:hypothetical protein